MRDCVIGSLVYLSPLNFLAKFFHHACIALYSCLLDRKRFNYREVVEMLHRKLTTSPRLKSVSNTLR